MIATHSPEALPLSSHLPSSPAASAGDRSLPLSLLRDAGLALFGSMLLAAAAHVAVPFWPVPMTLQTLAVLLIGGFLGPRVAAATVVAYWIEGVAGLPVFSHAATLLGPTTGYIIGYLPAAVIAGWAGQKVRGGLPLAAALVGADGLVFVFGVAWLATFVGPEKAFAVGVTPFLIGEALKIALATAGLRVLPSLRR